MARLFAACACLCLVSGVVQAAQISGEYLEARSCDVYTGPCFANAEMDLAGKEAVMAWRVEQGNWSGVDLKGLSVAVVARSEKTLGETPASRLQPEKIRSVVLVDERATSEQREALVAFAKETAKDYTRHIVRVQSVPMVLENDHLSGAGRFEAGQIAKIETRAVQKGDCVCTNEEVFYQPLTRVSDASPAYSKTLSYTGGGLDSTWTNHNQRSAFLATFRR